jgi:hypothetical protein
MLVFWVNVVFPGIIVGLGVTAWRASRGRKAERIESRAWGVALLVASIALFVLVLRVVGAFAPPVSVPLMLDRLGRAALMAYIVMLVPMVFAVRVTLAAKRRHKQGSGDR